MITPNNKFIEDFEENVLLSPKIMVVSDIHLGWERSNVKAFDHILEMVLKERPDFFIINGDFIDLWRDNFQSIINQYEDVFTMLRRIGNNGNNIRYILGNHDYNVRKYLAYFNDFPNFLVIGNELIINDGNKKSLFYTIINSIGH